MLARELERAGCMLPCRSGLASVGQRLRPTDVGAGCPQQQAIRLLELACELQMLIGFIGSSEYTGKESKPHSAVSVARGAVPYDLVGEWLDELEQDGCSSGVAGLLGSVGVESQR